MDFELNIPDEMTTVREQEINILNRQIYDLESLLEAKRKELQAKEEETAARIKKAEEKAL